MKTTGDLSALTLLRNTLGKMELSLSAIQDAIVWIDNDGNIQWCNDKFSQLVNKPHIMILGKSIFNLMSVKKNEIEVPLKELTDSQATNKIKLKAEVYEYIRDNETRYLEIYAKEFHQIEEASSIIVVLRDVTEKQKSLKKIEFLASIPENNPAPIFSIDNNKEIIFSNDAARQLIDKWDLDDNHLLPDSILNLVGQAIHNQSEYLVEEKCRDISYLFSITPGSTEYANIYGTNITARKIAEKELVYLSTHDMLTKLYNRSAFETALNNETAKAIKENSSFAVLIIDLDNFKTVNDTYGHHIGDQFLIAVAKQLQENIRKEDIVARLGGDEFIIMLANVKTMQEVEAFAKHLVGGFNRPFKLENHYFHATISVGIAVAPVSGKDSSSLLKNADIALYSVKELGKNNYQFFSNEINFAFKQRTDLETSLLTALENNEFFLVYQPQYKLLDKEIIGIEVLLRWNHPKSGIIMPDEFIPLAEKNGFITPIEEWMFANAFKQFVAWRNKGLVSDNMKMSIHISPKYLIKENFIESLQTHLQETGMPPKNLELELTETAVMTSGLDLDPILTNLQKMGITISIDDFGAGYSSLTRLKNLPISTLKIDKSFIKNISTNPDDAVIIRSIIALGDSLGLNVIPEGVETEEQLQLLTQYRCSMVEGFYFGKQPMRADEMIKFLKDNPMKFS